MGLPPIGMSPGRVSGCGGKLNWWWHYIVRSKVRESVEERGECVCEKELTAYHYPSQLMHAIIVRMSGEKAVPVSVPMASSVVAFLLRRTTTTLTSDAGLAGRCLKPIRGRVLANARWISDPLSNQVDLQNPLIHTTYLIRTLCVGYQSSKRSISSVRCVPFVLSHTHRTSDRWVSQSEGSGRPACAMRWAPWESGRTDQKGDGKRRGRGRE